MDSLAIIIENHEFDKDVIWFPAQRGIDIFVRKNEN